MIYTGKYYDGRYAASHEVHIVLDDDGIAIWNDNLTENWNYHDIIVTQKPEPSRPLLLTNKHAPSARLIIDASLYNLLVPRLPKHNYPAITISTSHKSIILWLLLSLIISLTIIIFMPKSTVMLARHFPSSWERYLGDYVMHTFNKELCTNPEGTQSLTTLISKLSSPLIKDVTLSVSVLNDKDVNAFALPGGKIIILKGLIDEAETPEELLGVIAHESGHIIRHHSTQKLIQLLGYDLIMKAIFGDIQTTGTVINSLIQLNYSRDFEIEADNIAVDILDNSHITSKGLIDFFERAEKKEINKLPKAIAYFSSHPSNPQRIKHVIDDSKISITPRKDLVSPKEWMSIKAICTHHRPM